MANLARVRVSWSGPAVVGSGVSTFYFDESHTGFVANLTSFFDGVKSLCPSSVTWSIPNGGDLIDTATGALSGSWVDGSPGLVFGTGSGDFPQGVGGRIRWLTNGIRNGRRVRGATYLVPFINTQFEGANGLKTAALNIMNSVSAGLVSTSAGKMVVWSPAVGGAGGQANVVISSDAPDKVSWLRSRRT